MKIRVFLAGCAVAAATALWVGWRAAQAREEIEQTRTTLRARLSELRAEVQRSADELAATQKESHASSPARTAESSAGPQRSTSPSNDSAPKAADSLNEWLEDPKVQLLYMANERANLWPTYGPFFYQQRLTPEQIEKLSDIIIASRMHRHDVSEINRLQGIAFEDPALKAAWERGEAETKVALVQLLGEDGYAKLADYKRALEVRTFVAKFAGACAVEAVPMSREQGDALTSAIANTVPTYALGGSATMEKVNWEKAEAQVQRILTPAQLKLLRPAGRTGGRSRTSSELSRAVFRAREEMFGDPTN